MYTKILLVVVIVILSSFFYLHTQNPGTVTFVVSSEHTYVLPATLLLFAGFFAGVVLAVLNSLLVDAKRAIKDMSARRDKKIITQADDNYRKGTELLVKGDTAGARELIEKALKAKPSDTGMTISLSETYIRENKPKEALSILESGQLNNPASIGVLIALAKCANDSGDTFRASKAYEEVLKIDSKNPYALRKLRDFRIKEGRWSEAASLQKAVVESDFDSAQAANDKKLLTGLLFEAASQSVLEGKLNESISKIKEILKNDDSFMPAHILLGEVMSRQGNVGSAIKVWEKALYKYPDSEPLMLKLEDIYIKESAPDRILEKYQKEIIARPNDVNLRLLLSRLYLRLEMVDNAIEELERLQLEGEDTFYPQILLGEACLRRKQNGKAAHLFQKALGLNREFLPPFFCSHCSHDAKTWTPRCPSCGEWNTLSMSSSLSAHKATQTKAR
ncbi:MAG: hypothetical protein HY954_04635 [Deltaproteobacteria bacterium]|nr:hypothetical protein [Deltaproteobacteria bacterium]